MIDLLSQLKKIKTNRERLSVLPGAKRNRIVAEIAAMLLLHQKEVLKANRRDINLLKGTGLIDRLELNSERLLNIAQSARRVAKLPDPLNKILEEKYLPNGLRLQKVSVPLGTLSVIYESRPNVTVDLALLAIKSGNALVLKGGSEAYGTNKILVGLIQKVLKRHRVPLNLVYLIAPTDEWKEVLLNAHGLVDVLIPRGGQELISWVRKHSKIPIIETGAGVCHTFVDAQTDIEQAVKIIINAKTQRPSVCNALDTLVIHKKVLNLVLPLLASQLRQWASLPDAKMPIVGGAKLAQFGVEIFADPDSYRVLKKIYPQELLHPSKPEHYGHEFLSLKMSVKVVKDFEQGLEFIKKHTSGHSEAILSRDANHINKFLAEIDAAVVYANASTRFTDGGEFGMGAEVGVSTQKLHARGPMGLESLTSFKWKVIGRGQIRQ